MQNQNEAAKKRTLLNPLRRLTVENKINELKMKLQDPSIISQLTGSDLSFIAGRQKDAWQLILSSSDFSAKLNEDDLNPMYLERPLAEVLLASPFRVNLSLNTLEDLKFFHPLLTDKIQTLISNKFSVKTKALMEKMLENDPPIQQDGIFNLPVELLIEIAKHLSAKDLATLSKVSKYFLHIANDYSVWQVKFNELLQQKLLQTADYQKINNPKNLYKQLSPINLKSPLQNFKDVIEFMENNVEIARLMMHMPSYTDKIFNKQTVFTRISVKILQLAIEENFHLISQLNIDLLGIAHHFPKLWVTILKNEEILDTLDLDRMKKYLYTSSILRGIIFSNAYLLEKLRKDPNKKFADFKKDSQTSTLLTNILLILGDKTPSNTAESLSTEQGLEKFIETLTNPAYVARLFDSISCHLLNIAYYAPELMPIIINTTHLTEKLTIQDLEIFRVFHPELENEIENIVKLKSPSAEPNSVQDNNNASNEKVATIQLASNNQRFLAHKEEQKSKPDEDAAVIKAKEIIKELKQLGKITFDNLKPYILKEARPVMKAVLLALEASELNNGLLREMALFDHDMGELILTEPSLSVRLDKNDIFQIALSNSEFAKLIKQNKILMQEFNPREDRTAILQINSKAKEAPTTSVQMN